MSDSTDAVAVATPAESVQKPEATNKSDTTAAAVTSITNGESAKLADERDSAACATTKRVVLTEQQQKQQQQRGERRETPQPEMTQMEGDEATNTVDEGKPVPESTEVLGAKMKIREAGGEIEVQEVSMDIGAEVAEMIEPTIRAVSASGEVVEFKNSSGDTRKDDRQVYDEQARKVSTKKAVTEEKSKDTAGPTTVEPAQEPCNFKVVGVDIDSDANTRANAERIQNVENCFGSSGQSLRAPGRVLVGEGVLTKMCRKKTKPRQVFLFNDILVYGNILIPKKKYIKQHIIPLEKVCLENIEESADMSHGWVIRTPTKSFVVFAASKTEKQQWMTHINTCINELLKKTGKHPSKDHAAVWVPDSGAGKCMVCKETKFTLLNRRHHCRKCGCVVCGNCSQHKFMLPSQSSKPLRVCDTCYQTLSMGKGDFADVDLSAAPRLPDSKPPAKTKDDSRTGGGKEQLSSSRDDTTDDSDDDEDDGPDQSAAEQAQLKEEKPTFYSGSDANKEECTHTDQSATIPNEDGQAQKNEACSQAQEKFDAMKITAEEGAKTNQ